MEAQKTENHKIQKRPLLLHGHLEESFIQRTANILLQHQTHSQHSHTLQKRNYCKHSNRLTHVDEQGKASMVDVTHKQSTQREATARAIVEVGPKIAQLIAENSLSKGDVLTVAQLAGIVGAKRTSDLIPLCHNIPLSSVKVNAQLVGNQVILLASVRCSGQTGVEMEALTAVAVAALTVYDMCKAVSHDIVIKDIKLWSKSGGKRNFQRLEEEK